MITDMIAVTIQSDKMVLNEVKATKCYESHLTEKTKGTFWPANMKVPSHCAASELPTPRCAMDSVTWTQSPSQSTSPRAVPLPSSLQAGVPGPSRGSQAGRTACCSCSPVGLPKSKLTVCYRHPVVVSFSFISPEIIQFTTYTCYISTITVSYRITYHIKNAFCFTYSSLPPHRALTDTSVFTVCIFLLSPECHIVGIVYGFLL